MWRIDGWMSQLDPPLTIDTSITLSQYRGDMAAITRHMSHASFAIVMFSRLSMVTGRVSSSVVMRTSR